MSNTTIAVQQYLETLHDTPPDFKTVQLHGIPVFLHSRYELIKATIFGQQWVLAVETEDWGPGTPGEYKKHQEILRSQSKEPVAFVFRAITSTLRNRLIAAKVPFIVPKTQVFLPMIYINLAERNLSHALKQQKHLTPTAQVLVLYEIMRGGLGGLPFKEIAATMKCSGTMITKARAELESRGICRIQRMGKETRMLFPEDTRAIWEAALPSLAAPVVKTRWIQWDHPAAEAKKAGLTALSEMSLMSDDSTPTYAIHRPYFTSLLEKGTLRGWPDRNGAHAAMQCWSYDPALLSDAQHVDPLSLYLSLRDEHNERIQGELETMLEEFPWQ